MLGYLVSLGIIGAGVFWIVAGTIWTASDLCIAIGVLTIAVGVDHFYDRVSQQDALTTQNGAVANAVFVAPVDHAHVGCW
jgi:cytochrome c biogenesis protein CcdA